MTGSYELTQRPARAYTYNALPPLIMPTDYQPIACGFYDELEAVATRRKQVYLHYFNDLRQLCQGTTTIKTFVTRDHAEYAVLASGEEIRLDHIIRLDNTPAAGFAEYPDFRCGC